MPKIKATRYWKSASGSYLYPDKKSAQYFSGFEAPKVKPVVVLPCDKASYDAMLEQAATAIAEYNTAPGKEVMLVACDLPIARIVLAAIGITKGAK